MRSVRRCFAALVALAFSVCALAQYPSKPVHIVTPSAAGAPNDIIARILGPSLSQALGQPVIIENKPGGDGVIGAEVVMNSAPDGYTLLMPSNTYLFMPLLRKKPPHDPGAVFAPVSSIVSAAYYFIVSSTVPAKTMAEFIAYARANPGKLNYAAGALTATVLTEALKKHAGINLVQIPYKSQNLAFPDLISGRVHTTFASASALTYVKEGKMRALAVTSDQRNPLAPDVPARIEAGLPPVSIDIFTGLFVPMGTPKEIVERLSREVRAILKRPEIREQADRVGLDTQGSSPEEFAAYLRTQREIWRQAIQDAGIQPN